MMIAPLFPSNLGFRSDFKPALLGELVSDLLQTAQTAIRHQFEIDQADTQNSIGRYC